jgi:hypothetical protein
MNKVDHFFHYSYPQIAARYKDFVTGAVTFGTIFGAIYGGLNEFNHVEKQNITNSEAALKVFGAIVVEGLKTGITAGLYAAAFPISVPYSAHLYLKDQKKQIN